MGRPGYGSPGGWRIDGGKETKPRTGKTPAVPDEKRGSLSVLVGRGNEKANSKG
jgi:hypothetical protein